MIPKFKLLITLDGVASNLLPQKFKDEFQTATEGLSYGSLYFCTNTNQFSVNEQMTWQKEIKITHLTDYYMYNIEDIGVWDEQL